ncbi:holin [Desnuesiella massiliensis]|uniref:holin n=1 Tax=Desnuesiella massiliensis TaxID=1650662 RepID=UPI0006E2C4F7|nr:holin [Desnuesiella massiliensis]
MKGRFRNYGLWLSILAFIPMLLEGFGLKVLPGNYDEIIKALLSILVLAGIISNPATESRWYLDDDKENKNIEETKK